MKILGIHHITAICRDAQQNLNFYTNVLGLRLVKRTVNYDDPGSYHLYYGDARGKPGSVATFFVWPGAPRGRVGAPQVLALSFAVPGGSLPYWEDRLQHSAVLSGRIGASRALEFVDPDGLPVELWEEEENGQFLPWAPNGIPAEKAIRGFAHAKLTALRLERTETLLGEVLGLSAAGPRSFSFGGESAQTILLDPEAAHIGSLGGGTVHHIAMRVPGAQDQLEWRDLLVERGFNVSPVMDRNYFRSIYFREPGGVLFELATDGPGFGIDEPVHALGEALKLPPWLEPEREPISRHLPQLEWPRAEI